MVCRGDLSDINGPLHHGGLVGPDSPTLLHDAELMGSSGEPMWDPDTGGGYDGLHADRVNSNRDAESTLAVISTLKHTRRLSMVRQ
jgi:hypothetical protein